VTTAPARVPVHLVVGPGGAGKSALIARLLAQRSDWLGFVNRRHDGAAASVRLAPRGCPCCTARVALQVALVRALRESRPARALIEIDDSGHASRVIRVLGELPFSRAVVLARTVRMPDDDALMPEELEVADVARQGA
jgi:G3E family GTPase